MKNNLCVINGLICCSFDMLISLLLLLISIGLLYLFLIWNFNYWTKRGITSPKPQPYIGNYRKSFKNIRQMIYDLDDIYRAYKDKEDFVGIFNIRTPQLLILNPELCQRIFNQDFKHFQDNEFSTMVDKNKDAIAANNPFLLTGDEWKRTRSFMKDGLENETLKTANHVIWAACKKMRLRIEKCNETSPQDGIKVKELCLHFTSEVITNCVFGFNFCGQPSTKFIINTIFNVFNKRTDISIYFILTYLIPSLKPFYKARIMPQRFIILFEKLMQTAIDLRKSQSNIKSSRDFLSYLLELQKRQNLSTLDLTTHSMNFLLHGLLGVYTILTHCQLLLAKYPKAQEKLRSEILQHYRKHGPVNFNTINELPYLEACIRETMRLIPPGNFASKICTEPILLSNKSGRSIILKKGEIVILPLYSIMNDESFYTNPKEFKPERFIGPNGLISDDFHRKSVYYGFGVGPRKCVGKRFALNLIKAALIEIFCNFKIRCNPKSKQIPETDLNFVNISLSDEIWLDFDAIS